MRIDTLLSLRGVVELKEKRATLKKRQRAIKILKLVLKPLYWL